MLSSYYLLENKLLTLCNWFLLYFIVKPKKTKIKKKNNQQKNLVKLDANEGIKVDTTIETTTIEPVIESKTTVSENWFTVKINYLAK